MCKGNIYAQVGLSYSEPLPLGLSPLSLAPVPIASPVDGVSAGHAGAGYGSRLSWQYRGLLVAC